MYVLRYEEDEKKKRPGPSSSIRGSEGSDPLFAFCVGVESRSFFSPPFALDRKTVFDSVCKYISCLVYFCLCCWICGRPDRAEVISKLR